MSHPAAAPGEAPVTPAWVALHARKVEQIAAQLRARPPGRPLSLRKRAVSHQVPKAGDLKYRDDKIDVRALDQILEIDPVRRLCVAEPGVTFVDLVAATLRHGLLPTTVPELKTITIGGAVSGGSLESMSFRHGGFHDSCLAYEVITGDGRVLTCARGGEQRLLFEMMHGSFGTLGILSRLTFRLIPAAPFVHVVHERHRDLDGYLAAIERHTARRDVDFVDGFIHGPREQVLCLGRFVEHAPYTHRYDWLRVFCHSSRTRDEDYLHTPDYLFRYDRGVTNSHPKSFLGRLLFGKLLGSSRLLRLAEKLNWLLPREKPTITVDVFLPISRVGAFFSWYQRALGHFPLWCVPYRRVRDYPWLSDRFYAGCQDAMFIDLAIYGLAQTGPRNYHVELEAKLQELGGIKTLISHNYYSAEEFWQIFNRRNYDRIKTRTDPDNVFRDLYDKTCRAARGLG